MDDALRCDGGSWINGNWIDGLGIGNGSVSGSGFGSGNDTNGGCDILNHATGSGSGYFIEEGLDG